MLNARLQDRAFTEKAPANIVEQQREKLASRHDKISRLQKLKEQLGCWVPRST